MLKLSGITKNYYVGDQTIEALRGLNIAFRENEFVSVLGPSGCGKTTLMNIIGGLDRYTQGELTINGKPTQGFKDSDWDNYRNKRIGFVFQSYNLIPHLKVLDNVELALTISGISLQERKKKAKEALDKVGLSEQLNKKPNQLSGGQMQRVAIARAIVNSPDILLLDEPTGALDTRTSEQILDLVKEIASDKLVIMVTHNATLAKRYSTRIVNMLDGLIVDDSMPYKGDTVAQTQDLVSSPQSKLKRIFGRGREKTSMSFLTALSLSMRNLFTKKGRTTMTAIAGSIGIIGVALILAISSGMNGYINKMQTDTLSSAPITISRDAIDINAAMNMSSSFKEWEKYPAAHKVFVEEALKLTDIISRNIITAEYITYVQEKLDTSWYNDIIFTNGQRLNFYGIKAGQTTYDSLGSGGSVGNIMGGGSLWQMLPVQDFLDAQYTALIGNMPQNKNQVVLIVDEYNKIGEETLISLGFKAVGDNIEEYTFDELINRQFKIVLNDELYTMSGSKYVEKSAMDIDFLISETLTISGIVRLNKGTESGMLSSGIGYTKELYEWVRSENANSQIVEWMEDNPALNPFTGLEYKSTLTETKEQQRESHLRSLGGVESPNSISIYPVNFAAKENIKNVLNDYNTGKNRGDMIIYTDMSEILGTVLSSIVNTITVVLVGFTAISLLVSSVMIGIITYVSVLERTKEIGILRSIGARKKDIRRVFNAETVIIGGIAGLIGVAVTYLLSIPINLITSALLEVEGLASLNILAAAGLVGISIFLTVISGLMPAISAARRDPVVALRTE
ncbi:MAG: ABC transporter ATP-binding protein/permease [Clostridia bacterium]